MCLKPIKILNPTKVVSRTGGQPLVLEVACGKCADCKKRKRLEWHFRSFHEVNSCVNHGGYCYFDTLTYRDEDVPHLSRFIDCTEYGITDFMCFDSTDWRNFLKNLRRQLNYHYPGISFKYFLTSEYGTDERFTHRPHYHILFFINSRVLDPYEFSLLVSKCWKFGRTDGLPYKTRKEVAEHVYGYDLGQKGCNDFLKVCSYVSKYITKDSSFQKEIDSRLSIIQKSLSEDDFNKLKRNVSMFSRCSQSFGISYLKTLDKDEYSSIMNDGICRIKDTDKIVLTIPLPLYYKRKLFYTCKKDDDGTLYWLPNSRGLEYLEKSMFRNLNNVALRYYTQYINSDDSSRAYIDKLLNGRTFSDFAVYNCIFKYHSHDFDFFHFHGDFDTYLSDVLSSSFVRSRFHDVFFRDSEDDSYIYVDYHKLNYHAYVKLNTFNENSSPLFSNFDKLDAFMSSLSLPLNKNKQSAFDFLEDLTKRFKLLTYVN